jgi:hypothetical protein
MSEASEKSVITERLLAATAIEPSGIYLRSKKHHFLVPVS